MNVIERVLAPLASLKAQHDYIVNGTKDQYMLLNENLDSAINLLFEQKAHPLGDSNALHRLKEAVRACEIPDDVTNEQLVYHFKPWIEVRESAKAYLAKEGFDLQAWEANDCRE